MHKTLNLIIFFQISIVAASYVCKQVRLFTDANPTMHLLDDIFKLFKVSGGFIYG